MSIYLSPQIKAIVGEFFNGPLAICPQYLDFMFGKLGSIEMQIIKEPGLIDLKAAEIEGRKGDGFVQSGNAAIIPVHGPISYKPSSGFFRWLFGGTSYAEILDAYRAAKSSDKISQIIFNYDSPGGTVVGFEDAVNEIYEGRSSKKIISYVNPYAASAAYGLASAGHEIHVMSSSGYGSIGTIMMHLDQSKFDEKLGAKWTPIFAGARKNDGNPHFPLSDRAKGRFQEVVDKFYSQFVSIVARNRGVSEGDVKKTEAELYYGDEGKKVGLIDSVVKGFDVIESSSSFFFIKDENDNGHTSINISTDHNDTNKNLNSETHKGETKTEATMTMTIEELKAKYPELFKQVQQEATAPIEAQATIIANENRDLKAQIEALQAQNKTLSDENSTMGNRIQALEEKDILRTESEMRARADAIWATSLANSDVPTHLHGDIRSFVSHGKFITNGQLDEKGFTDAVNAKIKDWEDKGVRNTVILGSGVPVSGVSEQLVREEKEDDAAIDALVAMAIR